MFIQAKLESRTANANRRRSRRRALRLTVAGSAQAGATDVIIRDLSVTGLLIETRAGLTLDEEIDLDLPEAETARARIVWASGSLFGCQFVQPIPPAAVSAALLQTPFAPNAEPTGDNIVDIQRSRGAKADPAIDMPLSGKMTVIVGLSVLLWALIIGLALSV